MATKYVTYCTKQKLDCGFTPNAQVILCVQDSALIVQPEPLCGLNLTTLIASVCSAAAMETGCQNFIYQYTFSYSDTQITDPSTRPLIASDITGVICEGCLTDWVMQQISCVGGGNCVEDSDSIDFSLTADSCITGDVLISADADNKLSLHADGLYATGASTLTLVDTNSIDLSYPVAGSLQADSKISATGGNQIVINADGLFVPASGGSGWSLTGDAGTVDGVNFLGTTDDVAFTIRTNDVACFRINPSALAGNPLNRSPDIIAGHYLNTIIGDAIGRGNGILSGGGIVNPSTIQDTNQLNVICGGWNHLISGRGSENFIGGGTGNVITDEDDGVIGGGRDNEINEGISDVIGGGNGSLITGSDDCFIGGGAGGIIDSSEACCLVGGNTNSIVGATYGSILGGRFNSLGSGANYASILGGGYLTLGLNSVGYQSHVTSVTRNLSAFSSIAYFGDVDLWVGNTDSTARKLKLFEPNATLNYSTTNFSSFEAQAQGSDIQYKLPSAAGTAGQQLTIDTVVGTVITLKWAA